ncbi:MAG TPA: PDZ domain-containing protein [Terriglobales bacterium]|nr:PDZ domain-containing protein [Terriglobales bacterium]
MKSVLYFLALILFTTPLLAQTTELPRHGIAGLALTRADEVNASGPVVVKTVIPGSAAEAAGMQAGDLILKIDNKTAATPAEYASLLGRHHAGEQATIHFSRNGQQMTKTLTLKPRPFEFHPEADVIYASVPVDQSVRRVIITKPKTPGRHPAIFLLGGIGCYSLDGLRADDQGYGTILYSLTRNGFVTMRIEKTGEGDSQGGPPCRSPEADLQLEARGYVAGLRALKKYDFVDPTKVFIFAHSIGPVVGSIVVNQEPVRGFIGAATVGKYWFEYELENNRRQSILMGQPYDQVEADIRKLEVCLHRAYTQKESPQEIARTDKECADRIDSYPAPYTYMRQLADLNLPAQWKSVNIPVLIMYGTSDPLTSADENRYLVNAINSFHPGRATYVQIEGMDHGFRQSPSQKDYLLSRGGPGANSKPQLHPDLLPTIEKWIAQQLQTS